MRHATPMQLRCHVMNRVWTFTWITKQSSLVRTIKSIRSWRKYLRRYYIISQLQRVNLHLQHWLSHKPTSMDRVGMIYLYNGGIFYHGRTFIRKYKYPIIVVLGWCQLMYWLGYTYCYTQYDYIPTRGEWMTSGMSGERRMDENMSSWMKCCDNFDETSTLKRSIILVSVLGFLTSLGRQA